MKHAEHIQVAPSILHRWKLAAQRLEQAGHAAAKAEIEPLRYDCTRHMLRRAHEACRVIEARTAGDEQDIAHMLRWELAQAAEVRAN